MMLRLRSRLIFTVCLMALLLGSLILVRDRLKPASPSPTTVQTLHAAWLAQHGRHTPTKWGMHLLLDDGEIQWPVEVWNDHLAYARELVGDGGYVLQLVRLGDLDTAKWQHYIDASLANGLKPMLRLASYSDPANERWMAPPKDANGVTYHDVAQEFARFIGSLTCPGVLYVTVGNEPNRGDEWGGSPNPAEYARYLHDVSAALRASNPGGVLVLNGALDQYAPHTHGVAINGFESIEAHAFLDAMNDALPEVWDAIDIWASHAYPLGPFQQPPNLAEFRVDDVYTDEPRRAPPVLGLANRGINSYRSELFHLHELGVNRFEKVIVTESGWRHRDSQGPSRDDTGATISAAEAASNLVTAFYGDKTWDPFSTDPWTPWMWDDTVQGVVLFAMDGAPYKWGHTNMVDLDEQGRILSLKPGFEEITRQ
jgi:hypothetical protein